MATSHLLATLDSTIESSRPDLELSRRHWTRLAHLCRMTTCASIHDLFEPVLTLAELADFVGAKYLGRWFWVLVQAAWEYLLITPPSTSFPLTRSSWASAAMMGSCRPAGGC